MQEIQRGSATLQSRRVVLAEYFVTNDDQTLLFIIRNDFEKPEVIEIKRSQKAIRQFVIDHFSKEQNKENQAYAATTISNKVKRLNEKEFQNFFESFISPLVSTSSKGDPMSDEGDIIWFVPHDVLHYIPMHAIKIEGRYLIERNPVCYSPSASVMQYCHKKRKGRRNSALIVGDSRDDLTHAREEAFAVAKLFRTTPFLGRQATKSLIKEKLKKEANDLDILHFSCHGKFNPVDPLKSHIVLAPEDNDDRYNASRQEDDSGWNLTASEIFGMEMHADLVTLSACESGVNDRKPGDELIGLTRSLIYAGTPSVVVSLWAVEDLSTSLVIQYFYQKLLARDGNQQVTKAWALQAAQQYVKNLKAKDVIDYCDKCLMELSGAEKDERDLPLQLARARAQYSANDIKSSLGTYEQIIDILRTSKRDQYKKLASQISKELEAVQMYEEVKDELIINYDVKLFEQIYYWAPFILVGDWK